MNEGTKADESGINFSNNVVSNVSGKVIYSTAGTNFYAGRVAHNLFYQVNGITTPTTFASLSSANVLDNSEDNTFANPFSSGEVLNANAVQHPILMADGITSTYPTFGAVQAQITSPVASHVLSDQTAWGINGNLSAGSLTLPAGSYVSTAAGTYGVAGTGSTPTLDLTLYTLTSTVVSTITAAEARITTATTLFGVTGTLNLGLYTLISGVVSAAYVVSGHDNYTGGAHGSYPTSATSYAVQFAADEATVAEQVQNILNTAVVLNQIGTYQLPPQDHVLETGTPYYGPTGALIDGQYSSTVVISGEVGDIGMELT